MRKLLSIIVVLFSGAALAQVASTLSDQEIADVHAICNDTVIPKRVPLGTLGNRPLDAGQYKPEWKQCATIDVEHRKRGLAARAKQEAEQKKLDELVGRIK